MSLVRSTATVGAYTLVSRVLGFLREILVAAFLGAGPVSDAFFVALRLPNLFRALFAEGAFAQAFVPIFSGTYAREGRLAALIFARDTFAILLAVLLAFLALGEIFTPAILHLVAPGFERDPAEFHLVVTLTRLTFPYLLFISLVSFLGGMLNAIEAFAANAAAASLLNLFLIATLLFYRPLTDHALAIAVSLSGIAQFAWLFFSCWRHNLLLPPVWPHLTDDVKTLLRTMLPGVVGASAMQINLVVSTAIASFAPLGSVSYLAYADRLNQLPLGVVGIAVATVILPRLSREIRTGADARALHTQNRGLELACLLTFPAAIALAIAAHPILAVLFQRGHFGPHEVTEVAHALTAYACGLPAFVLTKVGVTGFLARRDTLTPVKIALCVMLANAALTVWLGLYAGLAHVGIAAATSISGWLNALALIAVSHHRNHFRLDARARRILPRITLAALTMGAVLALLISRLATPLHTQGLTKYATLLALVAAGITTYATTALLFGAANWHELRGHLTKRA